ncbi:DUF4350 domain-containing protein [Novosphingobium sp. M1R2S20]|uniref:DUF4350 domain-containing protein n=1 Tax=Novosphingobium rhizovicinum TaxID=3228928 RepID=A0ABV3RAH6_9SPHN
MIAETKPVAAGTAPFTWRSTLALVLFGSFLFIALLWMIGNGLADGSSNNGGAHAEGRGLNGYAALASYLEASGCPVRRSRTKAAFAEQGLLVLTPEQHAKAADIEAAIARHRPYGPTLLVLPKWIAVPVPAQVRAATEARQGWVVLADAQRPAWTEELRIFGPLDVRIEAERARSSWQGLGLRGVLPDRSPVQSFSSGAVTSLVRDRSGQALAGYLDDGTAPALGARAEGEADLAGYPLVIVSEPDLLNNYGMADRQRAALALALVTASMDGEATPVIFDLTLAGLERGSNLLTLAFTPPFLAATICLVLAAAAIAWRGFLRFGPPLAPERPIAYGKRALVSNTAGLVVRSRRVHLLGQPYADAIRQRLVRSLALPRHSNVTSQMTALDGAARGMGRGEHAFSDAAARVAKVRSERELLSAAQDLHALERTLTR